MIRVLCVEDDALVRTYLSARLSLEPDVRIAGEAAGAGEALEFVRRESVDIILLDYRLEGPDGLQLLEALRQQGLHPGAAPPRVLFCTGLADAAFERAARDRGAAGVVSKQRMAPDLIEALRAVARGETWFPNLPRTRAVTAE